MGCNPSKNDVRAIQEATGMSKKEIKSAFQGFKHDAGGKKIPLNKFTKLVSSMNTNNGGNVEEYAKQLFRVLDQDKDNKVSFKEVLLGFHHLSANGNPTEKMRIVFQMYDVDNTKAISPKNVEEITKAQYKLQGKPIKDVEIEEKVKNCFKQCDLNSDGKITEAEFLKAGISIAEMFELETDD